MISMKTYNVAVLGATGAVGTEMLKILAERNFPVGQLKALASARSVGKQLPYGNSFVTVEEATESSFEGMDIVLGAASADLAKKLAPAIVRAGAVFVDNSSAFRMEKDVPLIVPEVNPEDAKWNKGIIANPNCSTIQAMVALKPLHDKYTIKRVVYSTYQAVSGAGVQGYNDLKDGINGVPPKKFNHQIFANCLPQIDVFCDNHYTKEEMKMVNETRKILHAPDMRITATTVRVPVFHGHSESINIEFEKPCDLKGVFECLENAPGLVVIDDIENCKYPMPVDIENTDPVYVGRIRIDDSVDSGVNIWCVADNIRKGAATNTVQIAELLIKDNLV